MDPRRPPVQPRRRSAHHFCFRHRRSTSPFHPSEPSSPKVSCMGQVRVMSTKRRRRRRSRRIGRSSDHKAPKFGEPPNTAAFRSRSLRRSHQSWVHLPFGCACTAMKSLLRMFCGPWTCGGGSWRSRCCCCTCTCEVCEEERPAAIGGEVVMVQEKGKGWGLRELEMVADKLEKGRFVAGRREGDVDDDHSDDGEEIPNQDAHVGRKNAVLLMRCRSDPTEMSALAACFVDSGANSGVGDEEESGHEIFPIGDNSNPAGEDLIAAAMVAEFSVGNDASDHLDGTGIERILPKQAEVEERSVGVGLEAVKEPQIEIVYTDQDSGIGSLISTCNPSGETARCEATMQGSVERGGLEKGGGGGSLRTQIQEAEGVNKCGSRRDAIVARRHSSASKENGERELHVSKNMEGSRRHSFSNEKGTFPPRRSVSNREGMRSSFSKEKDVARVPPRAELMKLLQAEKLGDQERIESSKMSNNGENRKELPECLLLMMYEPKLSMEVSRETWVCTADYLRWQPRHWKNVSEKRDMEYKGHDGMKEVMGGSVRQPEMNDLPYTVLAEASSRPLVLTRCKSEPARPCLEMGSQKGFFWKSRYEPLGAGDAGFLAVN